MFYLLNPGGRVVELSNEQQYDKYKTEPGFQVPTDQVIKDYINKRLKLVRELQRSKDWAFISQPLQRQQHGDKRQNCVHHV